MTTDNECVGDARECVRLAGLAANADLREKLPQMARERMATATHEHKPVNEE